MTKKYTFIIFPVMALGWIVFKCCYPYADFFTDSYTYIQAAADHDTVSYRPIGYSLFLRLVHGIWRSDTFLTTIQFVLVQLSCWRLFALLVRNCSPGVRVQVLIVVFLALDPLVYYLSNFVSSDALFLALSLLWFGSLLQMVVAPTWRGLVLQWVLLLMALDVRYTAMSYPLVALAGCGWLRRRGWFRIAAMTGSLAIAAVVVGVSGELNRVATGTRVFSAFGGWEIANNALNIYPHVPVDSAGWPPDMRALVGYVERYFNGPDLTSKRDPVTTDYMWTRSSPLHRYFDDYRRAHSRLRMSPDSAPLPYFTAWTRVSPIFSRYGYGLLRRHPVAFGRFYLMPSARQFLLSPLDVLSTYLDGKKEIDAEARDWFGYPQGRPRVCSATLQGRICAPFPWLSLLLIPVFAGTAVIYFLQRNIRHSNPDFTAWLGIAATWLAANMGFSIFAAPSVYRYQVLPLILLFIFTACSLSMLAGGRHDRQVRHFL